MSKAWAIERDCAKRPRCSVVHKSADEHVLSAQAIAVQENYRPAAATLKVM
jgi:hypothetical protein